ncbi:MAG: hypothetical protein DME96_07345 [Verrucomicrobia bacterium]|nr:MAG: hypothetical protein DME96_07345 [Verrucomicrobiota bacterium]
MRKTNSEAAKAALAQLNQAVQIAAAKREEKPPKLTPEQPPKTAAPSRILRLTGTDRIPPGL